MWLIIDLCMVQWICVIVIYTVMYETNGTIPINSRITGIFQNYLLKDYFIYLSI